MRLLYFDSPYLLFVYVYCSIVVLKYAFLFICLSYLIFVSEQSYTLTSINTVNCNKIINIASVLVEIKPRRERTPKMAPNDKQMNKNAYFNTTIEQYTYTKSRYGESKYNKRIIYKDCEQYQIIHTYHNNMLFNSY